MIRKLVIVIICLMLIAFEQNCAQEESLNVDVCEPISGECSDQGYSHTKIESFGDDVFSSQQAADSIIKSFDILTPCSKYLRIFLCAAYKPSCYAEADTTLLIRPCRSLCVHVFSRCYPLMDKFKRKWSPELNCSLFLDDSSQRCMNDPAGYERDPAPFDAGTDRVQQQIDLLFDQVAAAPTPVPTSTSSLPNTTPSITSSKQPKVSSSNNNNNNNNNNRRLICATSVDGTKNMSSCMLRCDSSVEFSQAQKQLARLFALVLNFLAFTASSIAILVFFLRRKFSDSFPINCFAYSSVSIVGHSLAQSIGLIIGIENLACEKLPAHLDDFTRLYRPLVYSPQPFDNSYCSLTFLATYFFSSCLLARWLTIAFLWHWMIWRRIDPSQLDRSLGGNYSNAFAFLVPVVSTILLLMTRHVEVSELTGLCTLGTLDADMLFKFVIFPSSVCLIIGLLFILAGYRNILVMRIRNPDRESSRFISSKNVVRRGMWSFLGSIPILTILGCQLIEYVGLDESNNNISNKQPITKLGLFLIKNGMYVFNAVFVLVLTCQVGFQTRRLVSSKKSTLGLKLHDSNETSDNTLNTSSSFERKLERNSTVDLFYQTGTEPRGNKPNRAKCACREYRINRSLMGANRSMTLSESFIRLPETPINEHHYCTPNLMAYQSVVCSRTSTTARPQNLGSKFVPFKLNRNDSNLITAKMSRNMSYNAKFI